MPQTIDRFAADYGFLSNLSAARVTLEGEEYPTVEHAFQAAKVLEDELTLWTPAPPAPQVQVWKSWRWIIHQAPSPSAAKRLGRRVPLRQDWEAIKLGVMRELLWQKFAPGRMHYTLLLQTEGATLIEGNTWGDTFWGVCNGKGENWLGRLLMEVREARMRAL